MKSMPSAMTAIVFLISLFNPFLSRADTENALQSAQNRVNEAAQEYYRGRRALGADVTPGQVEALWARTLLPAETAKMNAVSQIFAQRVSATSSNVISILKRKMAAASLGKSSAAGTKVHRSDRSDKIREGEFGERPKPQKGLDGSRIPKEIEFGGESKSP